MHYFELVDPEPPFSNAPVQAVHEDDNQSPTRPRRRFATGNNWAPLAPERMANFYV